MERRLIEATPVPYAVARALLARRIREVAEGEHPGDLAEKTWKYLEKFGKGDEDLAEEAVSKLVEMGLPDVIAANIVSICPGSRGEVRSILEMDKKYMTWDPEKLDAILEAIKDFCRTAE